ncbi:MAG: hypothetical protein JXI32_07500 [Deltaproteobacteria bacterium]|nr:hypothetical protein [Deltaproteobacteria bacterium]
MAPNADVNNPRPGTDQPDQPLPPDHAEKSLQKIAVLFTDIIGSTRFFQSHGNVAGRTMLRKHESIASKTITRFGGTVVKNLGDSILAYFAEPREAAKAAVEVQKAFRHYNSRSGTKHEIHVRIGIHFDEGIVEDKDIFGNAVNIASKITHLAASNEIFISHDVLALVDALPSLEFEPVKPPDRRDAPSEPALYRVLWEESIDFVPAMAPVLYMRPVRKPEGSAFETLWSDLIELKTLFWNRGIVDETITEDQTVILTAKRLAVLMDVVDDVFTFLREYVKARSVVPVQIVIDAAPRQEVGRLAHEGFRSAWGAFRPGIIFMSPSAHQLIEEEGLTVTDLASPGAEQPQSFHEIAPDDYQQTEGEVLFPHQDALSRGDAHPCFYCGGREHAVRDCPSKHLTGITGVLKKLGYLSFDRIDDIFRVYLASPEEAKREELLARGESRDQEPSAALGFYELKQIFQLRFLRAIWDSRSNDWDAIATEHTTGDATGELIWLAQDCIRVSNLSRAESLLETCLEKYPDDYRTYCTLGLLNMEKGSRSRSEQYLDRALYHAQTAPQKIFILFLLSRLYELAGDFDNALKRIRDIKNIQPYQPEASYREIVLTFKRGEKEAALTRLMSLIRMNREYYITALIDPDLAPFAGLIHPQLKKLFREIRHKAQKKAYASRNEFFSLEQFLVEGDTETEKTGTLLSKIQDLMSTDSYFGYADAADLGDSVISVCRGAKNRRKEELMSTVQTIDRRLGAISNVPPTYRSRLSASETYRQLQTMQSDFQQIMEAATFNDFKKFREMSAQSGEIIKELDKIDLEIQRVKRILDVKTFFLLFLKNAAFILSVILFAGIFILPTVVYYLSTFAPGFDAFTGSDIRAYHKNLVIFGVLGGLAFAFFKTFTTFFKDKD